MTTPKQEAIIDAILEDTIVQQNAKGPDLRQLHPKSHGLVWGEFIVEDNIPQNLRVGIFKNQRSYPMWMRFSNGSRLEERGKFKPDTVPDVRGLAIKLMDVEGDKIMDDEDKTQDFVMINSPIFFLKDLQGYAQLAQVQRGLVEPSTVADALTILANISAQTVTNPLAIQYWSTTPYQLGSYTIKYSARPHLKNEALPSASNTVNYLREAMINHLTNDAQDAYFDFLVQLYVDDIKTPVENPTIEWQECDSPPIKLATIKISSQEFDIESRKRLDEGMLFMPWHTLSEHQPIGDINLARRKIYAETARNRREHIQRRLREPQPFDPKNPT